MAAAEVAGLNCDRLRSFVGVGRDGRGFVGVFVVGLEAETAERVRFGATKAEERYL